MNIDIEPRRAQILRVAERPRRSLLLAAVGCGLVVAMTAGCANNGSSLSTASSAPQADASPSTVSTSAPPAASASRATTTSPALPSIDPTCADKQRPIDSLSVTVDGRDRSAYVHLPGNHPPTTPSPVVLSFHGAGDATGKLSEWDDLATLADTEGFVVVHPQGGPVEMFPGVMVDPGWDVLGLGVDEAGFVGVLLDQLAHELCVDPTRVYLTGISNGGSLALELSCVLHDRIAAIATVAASPSYACPDPRPIPTLLFHGLDDQFIPYAGDPTSGSLPIEQLAAEVAVRNGCTTAAPTVRTVVPGTDVLTWNGCIAPTELYRIGANGHAWPGDHVPAFTKEAFADLLASAGAVPARLTSVEAADNVYLSNPDVDATALMWDFFMNVG